MARQIRCPRPICKSIDIYRLGPQHPMWPGGPARKGERLCCYICGRCWTSQAEGAKDLPTTEERRKKHAETKWAETDSRRPGSSHD